MQRTENKAFTLIELLVVVAIIGILATVVVVNMSSAQNKARDSKVKADMETVQKAASLYYTENGTYPNLNCNPSGTTCNSQTSADTHTTTIINAAKVLATVTDGLTFVSATSSYQSYAKLPSVKGSSLEKSVCVDSRGKIGTTNEGADNYLQFAGNSSVTLPVQSVFTSLPFTYSITFQTDDLTIAPSIFRVNNSSSQEIYSNFLYPVPAPRAYFQSSGNGSTQFYTASGSVLQSQKYTFVVVLDATYTGKMYFYDNSGLKQIIPKTTSDFSSRLPAASVTLGAALKGKIFDIKFWGNKTMSDTEVDNIMKGGDFSSGLSYWYPMNSGSGKVVNDVVGGNNGTISDSTSTWGSQASANSFCTADTK